MNTRLNQPIIGISACRKLIPPHQYHIVGEKYVLAVSQGAGGLPVIIPALGENTNFEQWLSLVDGLMFTGSPSNVEPHHYAGAASVDGTLHDAQRDATTLPLIKQAVAAGIPVLGICRGFQEINVAYGGTLHQRIQELPDMLDHREDTTQALDVQYGPAHIVRINAGGRLAELARAEEIVVNSIHAQGVAQLGKGLTAQARAPDGLVEAFSVDNAKAFALAVQWHPEWQFSENPVSTALFKAFGEACRQYSQQRDPS